MTAFSSSDSAWTTLTNVGHFYGLQSLTGEKGALADIVQKLCALRRSDVLAWLCALSQFVIRFGVKNHSKQLWLAEEMLPGDLLIAFRAAIARDLANGESPGALFHLQQIWFMIQLTVICCNQSSPDKSDAELKNTLGQILVIANDTLQEIDKAVRPEPPSQGKFNEWCIGTCLPLSEVYIDEDVLVRSHFIWFECALSENVARNAIEKGIDPNISEMFLRKYKMPLKEFFLFLFALRTQYEAHSLGVPVTPHLMNAPAVLDTMFDSSFSSVAMTMVSQTPEDLSIRLLATRQSWSTDVSPLRERPLIQVFPDRFACPDIFLLRRMMIDRIFFLLEEAYPAGAFRTLFGYIFEEYVSKLIYEIFPSSPFLAVRFFRSPQFEGLPEEAADGVLHFGDAAVVMEWKAAKLSTRNKYGGDTPELVKSIRDQLARKGKGASQLSSVIKKLQDGLRIHTKETRPLSLSHCQSFYPMIVTAEPTLGVNYVRCVIQKDFDNSLEEKKVDTSKVKPLMILTIRDFECLEAAAKSRGVFDIINGYSRYIENNVDNPFACFRDYLRVEKTPFSEGLSESSDIRNTYIEELIRRVRSCNSEPG